MKTIALTLTTLAALSSLAFAGTTTSGKEMQQAAPVCPEWYSNTEFTVSAWGAYAFGDGGNDNFDNSLNNDFTTTSPAIRDEAAGGGVDAKFFFRRYFGVGVEAFGLGNINSDDRARRDTLSQFGFRKNTEGDGAGAVLGTFTFRYPLQCSRWSPYVWGGAGGIWGGNDSYTFNAEFQTFRRQAGSSGSFLGQFGGGVEYRFGKHIGAMLDISYNLSDQSDFGMARGGVTFAF